MDQLSQSTEIDVAAIEMDASLDTSFLDEKVAMDLDSNKRHVAPQLDDEPASCKRHKTGQINTTLYDLLAISGLNILLLEFLPARIWIHRLTNIYRKDQWRPLVKPLIDLFRQNPTPDILPYNTYSFYSAYLFFSSLKSFATSNGCVLLAPPDCDYWFAIEWIMAKLVSLITASNDEKNDVRFELFFHGEDRKYSLRFDMTDHHLQAAVNVKAVQTKFLDNQFVFKSRRETESKLVSKDQLRDYLFDSMTSNHVWFRFYNERINVFPNGFLYQQDDGEFENNGPRNELYCMKFVYFEGAPVLEEINMACCDPRY